MRVRTRPGQLASAAAPVEHASADLSHPRTLGWFGTFALAMGGSNQSLFLLGVLFISQGSAAVPLLIVGLLLSWMATPGWIELIMMWPNRVGGIAATCAEAFRPYSPVLANLTGVCYWWGWVPTCGLTAFLSASAIHQWYLPGVPVAVLACGLIVFFAFVTMCGVKWAARLAMPIALASATLAVVSMIVPVLAGTVNWSEATSFHLVTPFEGAFGAVTSAMAGLYLIGFAAPAFEAAACHVGETVKPNQNVPKAMFASAAMASVYFIGLPIVWLGALGAGPLEGDLAGVLGPTFAPALGGAAAAAAIWFMVFNMFHGTLQPLAGAARTLLQLAEDGLLPRFLGLRLHRTDAPWVATSLTAGLAIGFVLIGTPIWLLAAANLTYLIGICLPSVAVWLLRRNEPGRERPFRAPRGTIVLGVVAASVWGISTVLGFQQFGLPTVLVSMALAYAGSGLYAARLWSDRRRAGKRGFERSLHLKLTGAMLIVLTLDGAGYLLAVSQVPAGHEALVAILEDIFVAVALLTITVGLVLPGLIGHAVGEVAGAAARLATGTLADLNRAIHALGAGDLEAARARVDIEPIPVRSRDEIGGMAKRFNEMQHEIARAAVSLDGAREGLREANDGLARLSRQNELLLTSAGEAIVGLDLDGNVTFMNPAASQIVGYSADELIGRNLHETVHHSRPDGEPFPASECPAVAILQGRSASNPTEDVFWHKNGHAVPVNCTRTPIVENGRVAGAVIVASDMSAQRLLEAEVRQAQKMEAVGQLAGGVAHDFNNILTAISGYSEMALLRIDGQDEALRRNIEEIRRASDRAAAMTHQLLAFSRKQLLQPKVLDLNDVVRETSGLLSRLIGENIAVTTELEADLARTKADAGQVGQVLLNLALNARDAMPDGGELTIATGNLQLDESFARANPGSTPGWYVVLSVRDTGVGMDESVRSRIFEPFFTTKDPGKGTGLGLSTAYGIVKQSNGYIEVQSTPGSGTAVNVYLPRTAAEPAVDGTRNGPTAAARGAERILLVEDERIVRALVTESLQSQGYSVLEAEGPAEALELCKREPAFDLLVTDVVMPGMNGRELAQRLIPGRPELKVLFTSGYSSQVIGDGELEPGTAFLQKPFSLDELSQKVREVLETP